jgi:hypothetical protein
MSLAAGVAAASYQLPGWLDHTVVIACWSASVLFAVLYTLKAPWWSSWMGRNLFALDICIAGALTPGLLKYLFDVNPLGAVYAWFEVVDLTAVTVVVLHRTWLLYKANDGWNDWLLNLSTGSRNLYTRIRGRGRKRAAG